MELLVARWMVRIAGTLVILAGLVLVVLGLGIAADDAAAQGEMFDGLGIALGVAVGAVGLVPAVVAGVALRLSGRRPYTAGVVLSVLGGLLAAAGVVAVGALGTMVAAPVVLGGLAVAAAGFGAALVARSASVASPGGHLPR